MRKLFRILALSSMLILGFQNTNADCIVRNGQDANGYCDSFVDDNGRTGYKCTRYWGVTSYTCNVAASGGKTQG